MRWLIPDTKERETHQARTQAMFVYFASGGRAAFCIVCPPSPRSALLKQANLASCAWLGGWAAAGAGGWGGVASRATSNATNLSVCECERALCISATGAKNARCAFEQNRRERAGGMTTCMATWSSRRKGLIKYLY